MAITVGTELAAFGFTKPTGPSEHSTITVEAETESCFVNVDFTGTYAQADDATFAPAAIIQAAKRDGKTVTILQAAFCSAGVSAAGVIYGANACVNAAGTVTCELTAEDLTTEYANATPIAAGIRPVCFLVTYHQPIG